MLKLHFAHVALFLSKDVTHVIRTNEFVANSKCNVKKQRYGRAEKIVQLALQSQLTNSKKRAADHSYEVITTNVVIKQSLKCDMNLNHKIDHATKAKTSIDSTRNQSASTDVTVRRLRGYFIKVEDEAGMYKPLITEMAEWPKLYFDRDTPICHSKVNSNSFRTQQRKKRMLCELCDTYFSEIEQHLKGPEHQTNANNTKLFTGIDALISAGPTIKDLLRKYK